MKKIIIIFLLLFLFTVTFSEFITGKVVKVNRGDNISIVTPEGQVKIRFYGVNAPAKIVDGKHESDNFIEERVLNKEVKIKVMTIDKYDRIIGKVYFLCCNLILFGNIKI